MLLFGFNKQNSLASFSMSLGSTSLNIVSSRRLTSRIGTVLGHVALLLTNIASASKWSRWQASRRNKVLYRTKWYPGCIGVIMPRPPPKRFWGGGGICICGSNPCVLWGVCLTILSAKDFLLEDIPCLPPKTSFSFCIAQLWDCEPRFVARYSIKTKFSCHSATSFGPKLFLTTKRKMLFTIDLTSWRFEKADASTLLLKSNFCIQNSSRAYFCSIACCMQ